MTGGAWWQEDTDRREGAAAMWALLEEWEEAAFASFRERAIADLRSKIGAFEVTDKAAVKGRRVILVDDVFTTGTTAAECSRVLKVAKPKSIEVVTIAIVDPRKNFDKTLAK